MNTPYIHGQWSLILSEHAAPTSTRILFDTEQGIVTAAELRFEGTWVPAAQDVYAPLADSLFAAGATADPLGWGLYVSEEIPEWAENAILEETPPAVSRFIAVVTCDTTLVGDLPTAARWLDGALRGAGGCLDITVYPTAALAAEDEAEAVGDFATQATPLGYE